MSHKMLDSFHYIIKYYLTNIRLIRPIKDENEYHSDYLPQTKVLVTKLFSKQNV